MNREPFCWDCMSERTQVFSQVMTIQIDTYLLNNNCRVKYRWGRNPVPQRCFSLCWKCFRAITPYSLSTSRNGSIFQAFSVRMPNPSPSRIQTARSCPSVTWALAIWKKWPVTRRKSLPGKCLTAPFHQACHPSSAINLSISRGARQLTLLWETYISLSGLEMQDLLGLKRSTFFYQKERERQRSEERGFSTDGVGGQSQP